MKAAILFNFNWSLKFDDEMVYKGAKDLANTSTWVFPTVSFEALKWLFDERQLQILGTDTLVPELITTSFPVHCLLLGNNRIIAENLKDLYLLPPRSFRFHCSPVKYVGATGAQVRAYAMLYNDRNGVDRNQITAGLILCWIAAWLLHYRL